MLCRVGQRCDGNARLVQAGEPQAVVIAVHPAGRRGTHRSACISRTRGNCSRGRKPALGPVEQGGRIGVYRNPAVPARSPRIRAGVASVGQPCVAFFFELQSQFPAAGANDDAVCQHVHRIGDDVIRAAAGSG